MKSVIWRSIFDNGFSFIPTPLPQALWDQLYATFDEFSRSLGDDSDAIAAFNTVAKDWQAESGLGGFFSGYFSPYYRNTARQEGRDQKQIIQVCEPYYRYLYQTRSRLLSSTPYRRLLDGLMAALYSTSSTVAPLLVELKEDYPDVYRALVPDGVFPPVAIRLLSYSSDEALATNPHVDKSAVTVIVNTDDSADDPKLVFKKPDEDGLPMRLSEFTPFSPKQDQSVMFLGAALREAGHLEFSPLPHAVRPVRDTSIRHSAVFFWLLPNFDMANFDTRVSFEDDLGLARRMVPKQFAAVSSMN